MNFSIFPTHITLGLPSFDYFKKVISQGKFKSTNVTYPYTVVQHKEITTRTFKHARQMLEVEYMDNILIREWLKSLSEKLKQATAVKDMEKVLDDSGKLIQEFYMNDIKLKMLLYVKVSVSTLNNTNDFNDIVKWNLEIIAISTGYKMIASKEIESCFNNVCRYSLPDIQKQSEYLQKLEEKVKEYDDDF